MLQMPSTVPSPQVLIIGGGMITHDQLLPSLYHIQRQGRIGPIAVCASRFSTVRGLARDETLLRASPGQSFRAYPDRDGPPQPDLYREAIAALPPRQIVVVAVPDQLHYDVARPARARPRRPCPAKPSARPRRARSWSGPGPTSFITTWRWPRCPAISPSSR